MSLITMNQQDYFQRRFLPAIQWYETHSRLNKHLYGLSRFTEIFAALLIPLMVGLITDEQPQYKMYASVLAIITALLAACITLFRFKDNWINYRSTCETLKHHQLLFQTRTHPYTNNNPFPLFVETVEQLIAGELTHWKKVTLPSPEAQR